MFQRLLGIAALGMLLLPGSMAEAQVPLKIGFTNHEAIIAAMPAFQQAQQTLQRAAQQNEQGLRTMFEGYQQKLQQYQQQQAMLSAEGRAQSEAELIQLQQDIQEAEARSNEQLGQRQAELYQPIFEQVETAIGDVAREQGIDLVLRSRVGNAQPFILYVNEEKIVDITLDVARKLGLQVEG